MRETVIITGANDGIGRTMSLSFAKRGFALGLMARRKDLLEEVARQCKEAGASAVEIYPVDVTDSKSLRTGLATLDQKLGGMTIFVANAGISVHSPGHKDMGEKTKHLFDVNVGSAIDGIEWAKALMVERKTKGSIVGVSSIAGIRGLPASAAYCASKAAMRVYLEGARGDLKGHGITVTDVRPGFIDTPMTQKNSFPMPFLMKADRAGEIFANAIVNRKARIIAPWPWIFISALMDITPSFIWDFVNARIAGSRFR